METITAARFGAGSWRIHPQVALRPEPFGALAYHYGNRRLNFLRSPLLVTVLEHLADATSGDEAIEAAGVSDEKRPAFRQALASLATSDFLVANDD